MKKLKVILIGAGGRGTSYSKEMAKGNFQIVGIAEPIVERRNRIKNMHNVPEEMCFTSWEPLLELQKFADIAVIATPDQLHHAPAMKAIELGYNLLLEKPAAPTVNECVDIANAAKIKGVKVLVCHVLRYTKFFMKIKEMIKDNKVGHVLSIHHSENVGNLHHSHSYVRGNWGNTQKSSNMLLAKSCHDIDILQWLIDSKCENVHSFGRLSYFTKENAPEGSPDYCIEGCPYRDKCLYDATVIYNRNHKDWYAHHALQKDNATEEDYNRVLTKTQYGKCVFKCDNDVVDHQVVNLEYENGAIASFNMSSFNEGGRYIRIMGTEGEIYGNMSDNMLDYFNFKTREHTIIKPWEKNLDDSIVSGHGGGDSGIVETLYKYIAEDYDGDMLSEIAISVDNHITTFAAEKSRLNKTVVNLDEYKKEIGLL
ncbi:MAG: Gfo/Idh/MocA family oxidoreductase [Clostridia bacterium]|nr:Gfo/Idh/MocA family oxidoreductase [Clostridia bacterium]